jgi:hypothetical protein
MTTSRELGSQLQLRSHANASSFSSRTTMTVCSKLTTTIDDTYALQLGAPAVFAPLQCGPEKLLFEAVNVSREGISALDGLCGTGVIRNAISTRFA